MRIALITAALFCMAGNVQAQGSMASTSYASHTEVTWGHSESGSSHGEMRRGQQRRANRKAKRAAKGCHGSTSYAVAAPVAAEVACEACAVVAPVYVAAAPMYVPVRRVRVWRRPVVVAAPLCVTGQCPPQ